MLAVSESKTTWAKNVFTGQLNINAFITVMIFHNLLSSFFSINISFNRPKSATTILSFFGQKKIVSLIHTFYYPILDPVEYCYAYALLFIEQNVSIWSCSVLKLSFEKWSHITNSEFFYEMRKIHFFNYRNCLKVLYQRCEHYSKSTEFVYKVKLKSEQSKFNPVYVDNKLKECSIIKVLNDPNYKTREEIILKRYLCE